MNHPEDVATVDASLRLAGGVTPEERSGIVDHWAPLDNRLRSFRSDQVELQLTIKERDTPSQRTTLEAWIAGWPRLVATSSRTEFDGAINEVRDDMIRQLSDAKNKHEPRNNKHLRDTTRG
jgi:ribosome-associated translation inhibitor RaiA